MHLCFWCCANESSWESSICWPHPVTSAESIHIHNVHVARADPRMHGVIGWAVIAQVVRTVLRLAELIIVRQAPPFQTAAALHNVVSLWGGRARCDIFIFRLFEMLPRPPFLAKLKLVLLIFMPNDIRGIV